MRILHAFSPTALALAALLALAPACAQARPAPAAAQSPAERAEQVLKRVPLADGHNDWAWQLRAAYGTKGAKTADLSADPGRRKIPGHTSIPLIREGRLGLQLWSVYVPASLSPEAAVAQTFEQIDIARSIFSRHPETFAFVTTAAAAERAWKSGRVASFLAIEGAHQVADDIPTLRRAHAAGVRAMTLAHNRPTRLFDSASTPPVHNGIAKGGPAMIAEMNRLGILVDLSHVSPAVMHQVLDITKSPVVFTHSNAAGLTRHPRNVPDDVLKRLPANGGIVMITYVSSFVSQPRADWEAARDAVRAQARADQVPAGPETDARLQAWEAANPRPVTTLAMVADHVDYATRVAGFDHVGIGADFDGTTHLPQGLETVATYPALFTELARRGWTDANLEKLAGRNFLRVLRANEKTAARMR